jgi:hypothetical protein
MNKQELIEKYEKIINDNSLELYGCYNRADKVLMQKTYKSVLDDLKQLDEPQKPVVPQFVASWIANVKRNGLKQKNSFGFYEEIEPSDNVYRVMYYIFKEGIASKDVKKWVDDNPDTFARAWIDGYEIEKEKRYYVRLKAVDQYLVRNEDENFLGFLQSRLKSKFTRKQLEQAELGWVFDCPGIEIEEVEE